MARRAPRECTVEELEDHWQRAERYKAVAKAADEEGGPRLTLLTAPERSEAWPTDLLPPADPGPSADSSAEPGSAPAPGDGEAGDGEAGDGGAMPFDGVALPDSRKRLAGWSWSRPTSSPTRAGRKPWPASTPSCMWQR